MTYLFYTTISWYPYRYCIPVSSKVPNKTSKTGRNKYSGIRVLLPFDLYKQERLTCTTSPNLRNIMAKQNNLDSFYDIIQITICCYCPNTNVPIMSKLQMT